MENDLISRQAAIDLFPNDALEWDTKDGYIAPHLARRMIEELPSAHPEVKPIDYRDCADAMLMMWMWNVLTDGEYNKIMNKLNSFWTERREK